MAFNNQFPMAEMPNILSAALSSDAFRQAFSGDSSQTWGTAASQAPPGPEPREASDGGRPAPPPQGHFGWHPSQFPIPPFDFGGPRDGEQLGFHGRRGGRRGRGDGASRDESRSRSPSPSSDNTDREVRDDDWEEVEGPRRGPHGRHGSGNGGWGWGRGHLSPGPHHPPSFGGPFEFKGPHGHGESRSFRHGRGKGHSGGRNHGRRGKCGGRGEHEGRERGGKWASPFDISGLIPALVESFTNATNDNDNRASFTPPSYNISTETAHVLHVELPGVRGEDVNAHWDETKGELQITGVKCLQGGDGESENIFVRSGGQVGQFELRVSYPKEEIMKDPNLKAAFKAGILILTLPKTDIKDAPLPLPKQFKIEN